MHRPKLSTAALIVGAVALGALIVPGSAIAAQITSVFVTNTADHPVPVTGSVNIANLPSSQNVNGTVSISGGIAPAAPARPVVLRGELQQGSTQIALFDDQTGDTRLLSKVAIGSVTVTTEGPASSIYVNLRATDCGANGLGGIQNISTHGDYTEHLAFPVPLVAPVVGSAPFCVVADVLNAGTDNVFVQVVGYYVT
jgi:hypothetical protein